MESIDVSSQLEEGEIVENDFYSPKNCITNAEILGFGKNSLEIYDGEICDEQFDLKQENVNIVNLSNYRCAGYVNSKLKQKLKLANKKKMSYKTVDNGKFYKLSYTSLSDGKYRSDEGDKSMFAKSRHMNIYSYGEYVEERLKKKYPGHEVYGTAEDIMTQIDETICRKSRCNYKRRRSREFKYSLEKIYRKTSSDELTSQLVSSSHLSNGDKRRIKRKISNDSDSEIFGKFIKENTLRRKRSGSRRKKKKNVYCDEKRREERIQSKKLRDFDEVRRNLLEKLKKQKEEESKEGFQDQGDDQEFESSEIQEVDMVIESTSYVDRLTKVGDLKGGSEGVNGQVVSERVENEGDEEMDLTQLRLIALASNKKKKGNVDSRSPKTEPSSNAEEFGSSTEKRSEDDDGDLDRNELLLRAEALKTALLKKHQKRLNRLKGDKSVGSSSDNDIAQADPSEPAVVERGDETECKESEEKSLDAFDGEAFKENRETGSEMNSSCLKVPTCLSEDQINRNETSVVSDSNSKKRRSGVRNRKRKKKIGLAPSNVKEYKDHANEMPEEDDRTLRSQLLCDLIKKKSLKKDLEKKSILMDSMQTSVNNRPPVVAQSLPKVNLKPQQDVKNSLSKKANVPKAIKAPRVLNFPKPEIQRIIVHLGSDDSSDDDEGESVLQNNQSSVQKNGNEGKDSTVVSRQADESIQAGYERSVQLLLSQARKKIEGEMQKAKSKTVATPEAVYKHLPPSQRLEYIRLKQKIAERERLRKLKNITLLGSPSGAAKQLKVKSSISKGGTVEKKNGSERSIPSSVETVSKSDTRLKVENATISSSSNPGSKLFRLNKAVANGRTQTSSLVNSITLKSSPKTLINRCVLPEQASKLGPPPPGHTNSLLVSPNQALISKLKLLLKKIKIEKTMEENYEKEITKLKNQLNLFEKKKSEQRFKIKKLAEESTKIYRTIQGATTAKQQMAETKDKEGKEKVDEGEEKQLENSEEVKEVEQTGSGEVKVEEETKSEINKSGTGQELNSDNKINEMVSSGTLSASAAPELSEYSSPLYVFTKGSDISERVDPNVIMCQFDLMGICKDEECTYQHFRAAF